jgi:large subunit ribosomal protein L24
MASKFKKGDTVVAIAGKDKGKRGEIKRVLTKDNKVVVEKVNVAKCHRKPTQNSNGGIIEINTPIDQSNVMMVCSKCDNGVRVGFKYLENGKKIRICKKCGEAVDK